MAIIASYEDRKLAGKLRFGLRQLLGNVVFDVTTENKEQLLARETVKHVVVILSRAFEKEAAAISMLQCALDSGRRLVVATAALKYTHKAQKAMSLCEPHCCSETNKELETAQGDRASDATHATETTGAEEVAPLGETHESGPDATLSKVVSRHKSELIHFYAERNNPMVPEYEMFTVPFGKLCDVIRSAPKKLKCCAHRRPHNQLR